MRCPPMTIWPPVGVSSPPMRLSKVVLPEPEGPIRARKSPSGMSRSTPCRTSIRSLPRRYVFVTPRISTRLMRGTGGPPRDPGRPARLAALGELDRGAVLERIRRRQHHPLAGPEPAQHLAFAAQALAEA